MTDILGTLRTTDGAGVVRIERRYPTVVDDLWSALTDPERLARWYGRVEGDLRLGGDIRVHLDGADLDSVGRIEACEAPRHLLLTTRETDASRERGRGGDPFVQKLLPPLFPRVSAAFVGFNDADKRNFSRLLRKLADNLDRLDEAPTP